MWALLGGPCPPYLLAEHRHWWGFPGLSLIGLGKIRFSKCRLGGAIAEPNKSLWCGVFNLVVHSRSNAEPCTLQIWVLGHGWTIMQ